MVATPPQATLPGIYIQRDELLACRQWSSELNLFARRPATTLLTGNTQSRFRGRGMDFEEVRPYQVGDDIRAIDWRVTARSGRPHTKLYSEERERPVLVVVDQRSPLFFGSRHKFKAVLACELAAALAWSALQRGDRVGGLVFGDRDHHDVRPRRSRHSVLTLIHQLIAYNHRLSNPAGKSHNSLTAIVEDIQRIARPGSAVFLLSDFHDLSAKLPKAIFNLQRHCDLTLCRIHDPLDQQLPPEGIYRVSDGKQHLSLNTADRGLQDDFYQQQQRTQQALRKLAQQHKSPLLEFSTEEKLSQKLHLYFGNKRRRG